MMARKSQADYRDAVKLGDMLCSHATDEEKRERLLRLLAEFEETAVALLINNRIKRYADQTAVHIAAKYGLSACLEILLKRGGMFAANYAVFLIRTLQIQFPPSYTLGNPNVQSSQPDFHQVSIEQAMTASIIY